MLAWLWRNFEWQTFTLFFFFFRRHDKAKCCEYTGGEAEITSVPGVTLKLDLCKSEITSNKKVNKSKDRAYELLQA